MAFHLNDKILALLQNNREQHYTAYDIAKWIFENYKDDCEEKRKKSTATKTLLTTDYALIQQISSEIGARRPDLEKKDKYFKTINTRPRLYYYSQLNDDEEIKHVEEIQEIQEATITTPKEAIKITEHDLYPKVIAFLWAEYRLYSKRIDERKSKNTKGAGGNKWLYPDIVAMEDLSQDWHDEIKNCAARYFDKKTKLWSFEVKLKINRSNIREVFFQAVSNSTWANYGYLVSPATDDNTMKELRILASLHGIGFIQLNSKEPTESQILIPAKERTEIDWNTANRLAEENKNFLSYIKSIRHFYQTGNILENQWDNVTIDED